MKHGDTAGEARLLVDIRRMERLLSEDVPARPSADARLVIMLGEAQARRILLKARLAPAVDDLAA